MSGSGITVPCAACKYLRRRCTAGDCVFAPYFPPHEPQKFVNVHKIYGASNVSRMLLDVPVHQRAEAAYSLVYHADARVCDPVYGCVGVISALQQQVAELQKELAIANAEMVNMQLATASVGSIHDGNENYGYYPQYQQPSPGGQPMMGGGRTWSDYSMAPGPLLVPRRGPERGVDTPAGAAADAIPSARASTSRNQRSSF